MRTLNKNKQKMYYANLIDVLQEEYVDEDGNRYPTGEPKNIYSEPIEFKGNIAMSGGEAEAQEFGIDVSSYDAILITSKDLIPIDETSLIWFESEVVYENEEEKIPDEYSADYKVLAVKPSLNVSKYILGRRVK